MGTFLDVAAASFELSPAILILVVLIILFEWGILSVFRVYRTELALLLSAAANILSWGVGFAIQFLLEVNFIESAELLLAAFAMTVIVEGGFLFLLKKHVKTKLLIISVLLMNICSYVGLYLFIQA